jgi:hypothetical protein
MKNPSQEGQTVLILRKAVAFPYARYSNKELE